jgi:transposase InsO family protein
VELKNVPEGRKVPTLLALAVNQENDTHPSDFPIREEVRNQKNLGFSLDRCISELKGMNKQDHDFQDWFYTYRLRLTERLEDEFTKNQEITGFCSYKSAEIRFQTKDDYPVKSHQYRIPTSLEEHRDQYFEELLRSGTIEEETSMDHSLLSILVVPKYDLSGKIKGWRTCLDPRNINVKIIDPIYPLPMAEDIFASLKGKKVFSILDLKSGFNQIRLRETDRKKTAFQWRGKVYHFVGAPFGFKNIPQDFQQIMDRIFQDMTFVLIYIDDIIIASDSLEEHTRHVKKVLDRLNEVNLKVNKEKCMIAYLKLVVLGNIVSEEGQQVALDKLIKMDDWKNPVNLKMLQRQLGFLNYFRGYIPNYSHIMAPVEQLRLEGNSIKWTDKHSSIMQKIRQMLATEVLLEAPDYSKPLYVGTDASKYGLGAILYQIDETDKRRYIRMASRSLKPSEIHYGAPQRELRAVLEALRWFKVYLYGRKFVLYTDHQSLVYMLTREKISSVVENWMYEILSFDFEIKHLPGIANQVPDALSRFYDDDPRTQERPDYVALMGALIEETCENSLDEIWVNYAPVFLGLTQDQEAIEEAGISGAGIFTESIEPEYLEKLEDNKMKESFIWRAHINGHRGAGDMVRLIKSSQRVIWPNMFRDCQKHVASCLQCQRFNIGAHGYHPPKNLTAILPFDHVVIDLKEMPDSKKGCRFILVLVDVATRFIFLRALTDKSMYSIAQHLLRIFCDVGFPKILGSDNGTEFSNQVLDALKSISKIDGRFIAPYHHRANGMVERSIRTISEAIYKRLDGLNSTWDEYLPSTQYHVNTRVMELHGSSPYSLLFARRPNDLLDYRTEKDLVEETAENRLQRLTFLNAIVFPAIYEKVNKKHIQRNESFMKHHRMLREEFPMGSVVMIKDEMRKAKTDPRYEGPFSVIRREGSGNYLLKGLDGTEYSRPPQVLKMVAPDIVKDLKVPDTIFAAVKEILDHKELDGETLYLTRWKDQGPEHDSWIKRKDFVDYGPLRKYEKKIPLEKTKLPVRSANGVSSKRDINQTNNLKIAKAGQRNLVEFDQRKVSAEREHEEVRVSTELSMGQDQLDAIGEYWKTRRKTRKRNQPIVESGSDEEEAAA